MVYNESGDKMDRVKIKEAAKKRISGHVWELVLPFIISGLLSSMISYLFGENSENLGVSISASMISTILTLPLSFGCVAYLMAFLRGKPYDLKLVFSYYKKVGPIFAVWFLVSLFSTLWTLLLIIPGIIASISYSMTTFIFLDGEENALECIRKSKKMMYGYKADYFMFLLSFAGWFFLGILSLGLLFIWIVPYLNVANLMYYEELKKLEK